MSVTADLYTHVTRGLGMTGQRRAQTHSGPGRLDGNGNEVGVGGLGACFPIQAATDLLRRARLPEGDTVCACSGPRYAPGRR
jgi:hypothetical protein